MNRNCFVAGLALVLVGSFALVNPAFAGESMLKQAESAIKTAEAEVQTARSAIERGKALVALIPQDDMLFSDVARVLEETAKNWKSAVTSLEGAKESLAKGSSASKSEVAEDFALLAKVNAGVAVSGAKVVQISVAYIDSIANNKTEASKLIRVAMRDALNASARIQQNYGQIKSLIAEKYTNE